MADLPVSESKVAFDAPNAGKPSTTWYKVVGDLDKSSTPALIVLHGGPGAGHEYLAPFTDLYKQYGIPIVFYDQIGCGRSTHFQEKIRDDSFWTVDLFIAELDNLVDHLALRERGFFVAGQSWGGMLAGSYASRRPHGLKKLIVAGAPASFPLFVEYGKKLRAALPTDIREILEAGDRDGSYETSEYERASAFFYSRHVCSLDPLPEPVKQAFVNLKDDPTSYHTMQGPSEIVIDGNLKDWEGWKDAHNIQVDTLLLNGRYDEVGEPCVEPWFRVIPRIKWVVFEKSSHMAHWEERERFMQVVGTFLTGY
ncbi:proline-specific peptidase [Daldinia loculata]|uniref:proline-specific peptidase n=1 Tax=Daldinia loculata TaxID=103429 RepID=UPI0020C5A0FD|nr:proline-specific peptidase [Daldinia loculata]KAI1651134.1 proline-specific peptidase [Daldinia loculata]